MCGNITSETKIHTQKLDGSVLLITGSTVGGAEVTPDRLVDDTRVHEVRVALSN